MLPVLGCFVVGWAARSRINQAAQIARTLEIWVIWIALPALVLVKMPTVEIGTEAMVPVAGAWLVAGVSALIILTASRAFEWDRLSTGALLLVVPLGNTGFLGIAATRALLGEDHVALALTYDQLGTFILLVTYGSYIASRYGNGETSVVLMLKKLVTFPPFIALMATIAIRRWPLPESIDDLLFEIGNTVSYVAMFALGLRFTLSMPKSMFSPVITAIASRMFVVPAAVITTAALVNGQSLAWEATQLQAAMPPMIVAGLLANSSGLNSEIATFVVGTGTIVSFATLPLIAHLI